MLVAMTVYVLNPSLTPAAAETLSKSKARPVRYSAYAGRATM